MKIGVDIQGAAGLAGMAAAIRKYPAAAARSGWLAANDVGREVLTAACRDLSSRYNLPASFIKEQFSLAEASEASPAAVVSARRRALRLARFDARQMTAPAPRAKGDKRRKIQKGRKQAGISVKILRTDSRKTMPGAFFIPLRAGKVDGANGMGLFLRTGPGKDDIEHKYGIAPYQAFRAWIREHRPDLQARLLKAWSARFRRELARSGA